MRALLHDLLTAFVAWLWILPSQRRLEAKTTGVKAPRGGSAAVRHWALLFGKDAAPAVVLYAVLLRLAPSLAPGFLIGPIVGTGLSLVALARLRNYKRQMVEKLPKCVVCHRFAATRAPVEQMDVPQEVLFASATPRAACDECADVCYVDLPRAKMARDEGQAGEARKIA